MPGEHPLRGQGPGTRGLEEKSFREPQPGRSPLALTVSCGTQQAAWLGREGSGFGADESGSFLEPSRSQVGKKSSSLQGQGTESLGLANPGVQMQKLRPDQLRPLPCKLSSEPPFLCISSPYPRET